MADRDRENMPRDNADDEQIRGVAEGEDEFEDAEDLDEDAEDEDGGEEDEEGTF